MSGALDAWKRRSIEEATLRSGMQARVRKPRTDELVRDTAVPADLRTAVLKVYNGATKLEELEPEQFRAFLEQQDRLVSRMVLALRDGDDGEWEEVALGPEDLADLPPDDVEDLRDIGNRRRTVAEVTAHSLMQRELLSRAQALHVREEEQAGTVGAWAEFRGGRRGADPGPAGQGVAPAAVGRAPARRGRRRAGLPG